MIDVYSRLNHNDTITPSPRRRNVYINVEILNMNNAIHEAVSAIEADISEIDGTGISDKTLSCVREKSKIVRSHVTTYDTAAILRQNVADLERELQRQRERAEKAEAELKAARIDEDCLKCSNRGKTNGLSQESFCDSCIYQSRSWRVNHFSGFSANPQSPAVKYMGRRMSPDGTKECWGFDISDELPMGTLLYTRPTTAPAPAVPEEWREVMAGLVAIAEKKGKKQGSPNHCHQRPGVWDDDNDPVLSGQPCAECAIYDKARALLQSAGGGE